MTEIFIVKVKAQVPKRHFDEFEDELKLGFEMVSLVFNLKHLSQNFIKSSIWGDEQ